VTGRIVAAILTDVDDASQVEPLLDRIAEPVELFLGDGGCKCRVNTSPSANSVHRVS